MTSEFLTSNNFVSWKHCDCGESCLINCIGMPTLKGVVLFLSVVVLITFFAWVYFVIRSAIQTSSPANDEQLFAR